ncbi:hypothetical protein [Paracraurococcus lichenis]|uniref:Lipoprotein n=1 Tax=Paracraurococcus lichenis TaxID=3064888 RepID=A0ABT9DVJ7_9PROT|nr:hypothetical protein [Paracraurococcus sp. LOR1-02]MDO9707926.1 hypothetical protein [Paracraurococcus sp. LOR1-02]
MRCLLPLLTLLVACAAEPPAPVAPVLDLEGLATKAAEIGALVRAAQLCALPLSQPAQDRAARIEAAAILLHQQRGGTVARDAFLRDMAPPAFEGRQRLRERAAWCATKRPEVQQVDAMLNGAEGTALVQRAEDAEARLR